jgi:L-fuculose-phosphate aldolase
MDDSSMDDHSLRKGIVEIGLEMYRRDFISGSAGNISARLPNGNLLITPSGINKGKLTSDHLLIIDLEGNSIRGDISSRPSSELPMHLEVYRQRPDVHAVIHAHPITCVALSLVGISLQDPYIPEALVLLGSVPTTPYATPSSTENRDAIAGLIADHDAIILAHHGSLTVGRDLEEAYARLEILEHTAKTVALAFQMGTPRKLELEAVQKLLDMRQRMGLAHGEETSLTLRIAAEVERLTLDLDALRW